MVLGLTRGLIFFCFQAKIDLTMYDQVAIEKAKKRDRAYQCLACRFKKRERWVDEIRKLEDHILRTHMPPVRIPFTCQLCMFKYMRRDQLLRHVSHYVRHVTMATGRNIINHETWFCSSEKPYVITELDYFKLSPEERSSWRGPQSQGGCHPWTLHWQSSSKGLWGET